jgi:hypothetical protein
MVLRPSGLAKPIRRYLNGWELWASSQFQERTPAGGDIGGRATKPNTPKDTLANPVMGSSFQPILDSGQRERDFRKNRGKWTLHMLQ